MYRVWKDGGVIDTDEPARFGGILTMNIFGTVDVRHRQTGTQGEPGLLRHLGRRRGRRLPAVPQLSSNP